MWGAVVSNHCAPHTHWLERWTFGSGDHRLYRELLPIWMWLWASCSHTSMTSATEQYNLVPT